MKLCRHCCTNNEIAPATVNVEPDTPARNPQEVVASTSIGPFESDGESREEPSTVETEPLAECFPQIRVDKSDALGQSLLRHASFQVRPVDSSLFPSGQDSGSFPASFQMLILSWIQPMDSKANTKLFGSAKAVKHEQTRHKQAGWIIHPCSMFRSVF